MSRDTERKLDTKNRDCCKCHDNKTIEFYYRIALSKGDKCYLVKEDNSKSFLRQFAALINSFLGTTTTMTARNTTGNSVTVPIFDGQGTMRFTSHFILVSNNYNDRVLTFEDFNIAHISPTTRVSGFPQLNYTVTADRYEFTVSDAHLYTGSDTSIYAIGLRVTVSSWHNTNLGNLLIAKDVFDPPLTLQSNSRVDVSYKIVVSL